MRSPLSSRTNRRPVRLTPDEFFDLLASSVVMICPSIAFSHCIGWLLFGAPVQSSRVKVGKSRQIAAKERGGGGAVGRTAEPTAGISQVMRYDLCQGGEGPCASSLESRYRNLTDGAAVAEHRELGRRLSSLVGGWRPRLPAWLARGR